MHTFRRRSAPSKALSVLVPSHSVPSDQNPTLGGLFDGFESYRTASSTDIQSALQGALVVFDANVLLNLYRYREETRNSIVEIVRALGDRFWLPRQVLEEFWRNRERALASPLGDTRESIGSLQKQFDLAVEVLRRLVKKGSLSESESSELEKALEHAYGIATQKLNSLVGEDQINVARNTSNDPVLGLLEEPLRGRVGPPMDAKTYEQACEEGRRRMTEKVPPGTRMWERLIPDDLRAALATT